MDRILLQREILMSGEGTLSFYKDNTKIFSTQSWEHAGNLVPPKVYTNCSKTQMASSGRPAIYIPDDQTGKSGIFIHAGVSQSNSEGCICIHPTQMQNLLNQVSSEKGAITIEVKNP